MKGNAMFNPQSKTLGGRLAARLAWVRGVFGSPQDVPFEKRPQNKRVIDAVAEVESMLGAVHYGLRTCKEQGADEGGAAERVARGAAFTLTGARAAVWIEGFDEGSVYGPLLRAVRHHAALVLYLIADEQGGDGVHAELDLLQGSGAVVLYAAGPQEAVDLSIVARVVAETSLTPVVVVMDKERCALAYHDVVIPEASVLEAFVGAVGHSITSPTKSQRLLFGEQRRRLPRLFDTDRPVALGLPLEPRLESRAIKGQGVFFADHLPDILEEALNTWTGVCGRHIDPWCVLHAVVKPGHVLVTSGADAALLESARQALVDIGGSDAHKALAKLHVIVLNQHRPLPKTFIAQLQNAKTITVVERRGSAVGGGASGRGHLCAELTNSLPTKNIVGISLYSMPTEASFQQCLLGASANAAAPKPESFVAVHDVALPPKVSDMRSAKLASSVQNPKIQALAERIAHDYPQVQGSALAVESSTDLASGTRPPRVVRRYDSIGHTYDNVARFYGETIAGLHSDGAPMLDPYLTLGAVPPHAASMLPASSEVQSAYGLLPVVDSNKCIGCGACWTACPDSALMPVALGTQDILDAVASWTPAPEEAGALKAYKAVRRGHKAWAMAIDKSLAEGGSALNAATMRAELKGVLIKAKTDDERTLMEAAAELTMDAVAVLSLTATPDLFHTRHRQHQNTGLLLMLSVDPNACQGCGGCATACRSVLGETDAAIDMQDRTLENEAAASVGFEHWDKLPDTTGQAVESLRTGGVLNDLQAILLSRHCAQSMAGRGTDEPGSGKRMALRQISASTEFIMQRRFNAHAQDIVQLRTQVRAKLSGMLQEAGEVVDLQQLERALKAIPNNASNYGSLVDELQSLGHRSKIDVVLAKELTCTADALDALHEALVHKGHGGRARYALHMSAGTAPEFPRFSFAVPALAQGAHEHNGAEWGVGLAQGLLNKHVDEMKLCRRARVLIEGATDIQHQLQSIDALCAQDLSDEEFLLCSPLLLTYDLRHGAGEWPSWLSRLSSSGLPIKVLLFDGGDRLQGGAHPLLQSLFERRTYVTSVSIAHGAHLLRAVDEALSHRGAALLHVYTPSPEVDGFHMADTLNRAMGAVQCRLHPLLRYNPLQKSTGMLGDALDLSDNPDPLQDWAEVMDQTTSTSSVCTLHSWARAEERFAEYFGNNADTSSGSKGVLDLASEDIQYTWHRLRELSGLAHPFEDEWRERLTTELQAYFDTQQIAQEKEHQEALSKQEQQIRAEQAVKLRARLAQLAGLANNAPRSPS